MIRFDVSNVRNAETPAGDREVLVDSRGRAWVNGRLSRAGQIRFRLHVHKPRVDRPQWIGASGLDDFERWQRIHNLHRLNRHSDDSGK